LVGADEHVYAFNADSLQWLADTDLLEMLVDKLSPPVSLVFTSCLLLHHSAEK
jgi:serine/threonine-protein phosphatase 6 regulatory subunit 3